MKKSLNSPATIFTLLQGITVLLSVLGVWVAGTLLYAGILALQAGHPDIGMPLGSYISLLTVGFLTVLTVSGACAVLWATENWWGFVMGLYWFQMLVVAVLCAAVALIARALALLVGRAVALQEEVDLTV